MLITRESELREALAEGRAEGRAEVVKNMSKKGFTPKQISDIIEIALEDVKKILGSEQ